MPEQLPVLHTYPTTITIYGFEHRQTATAVYNDGLIDGIVAGALAALRGPRDGSDASELAKEAWGTVRDRAMQGGLRYSDNELYAYADFSHGFSHGYQVGFGRASKQLAPSHAT